MKLCISTLGCPEWSFSEIVTNFKDLNLDGIEIRGVENELYAPRIPEFLSLTKEELAEKLKGLEIPILTSAAYLHREGNFVLEAKDYIDTAKEFGIPYVRVLGDTNGKPGENVDLARVKEALIELNDYAKDTGVTILLETNGVFANTEFLRDFLKPLGLDQVAVLWDIHHPFVYFNESPQTTWQNIGDLVRHVHVKDSVVDQGQVTYQLLGQGNIPLNDIISVLKQGGYQGYLSLEWLKRWNTELEDGGIVFPRYQYFMKDLLAV